MKLFSLDMPYMIKYRYMALIDFKFKKVKFISMHIANIFTAPNKDMCTL